MIGRVLKVKENSITLGWLIGGYKRPWSDWKRTGKHQTQEIPLEDILMKIEFVENKGKKKLSNETIMKLKEKYNDKEKAP